MSYTKSVGNNGEALCSQFLKQRGWKILKKNLMTPYAEVDILCERQGCLWAVEVKTRRNLDHQWIAAVISPRQKRRVARGLIWFAMQINWSGEMGLYLALVDDSKRTIRMFRLPVKEW